MKLLKSIIIYVLSFLTRLIPIGKVLSFHSFPDYTDNSYAFFKYIEDNNLLLDYKVVWLVSDKSKKRVLEKELSKYNRDISVYSRWSILGFWYFYRAKHVFITHGLNSFIKPIQKSKIVNLWHGMPFKRILSELNSDYEKINCLTISTSRVFQKIMAKSFLIEEKYVLNIGQPRNDLLFTSSDYFIDNRIDTSKYDKVGIWMPTFIKSITIGYVQIDGDYKENNVSFLNFDELNSFDSYLNIKNIFLILKLHPMDYLQNVNFPKFKNILVQKEIDNRWQLYPLLGKCDFLLTDYSSVWIDYLILKRPIGFVMDDFKEYKDNRGINFSNLEEVLPGEIIQDYDSLETFLDNLDSFKIKSDKSILNEFYDNKSSERLFNTLFKNNEIS